MAIANFTSFGSRQQKGRRGRQQSRRRGSRPAAYGVLDFVWAYLLAIAAVLGLLLLGGVAAGLIAYFVAGITLSRFIGNRVRWLKFTSSIQNVSMVKLRTVMTWPVAVPKFILSLAISRWF